MNNATRTPKTIIDFTIERFERPTLIKIINSASKKSWFVEYSVAAKAAIGTTNTITSGSISNATLTKTSPDCPLEIMSSSRGNDCTSHKIPIKTDEKKKNGRI